MAARTVDEYLRLQPADVRLALRALRRTIRAAAPMAEEVISYQIPTYKHNGPLVHFMARGDSCSLITVSKEIPRIFAKELKPWEISGTTIHFTPEKPLPASLVGKVVKARVKQNEQRGAGKPGYGKRKMK